MRTFLGGGFRWRGFFLALHAVDRADQQEYGEGHDQEADDSVEEKTVIQGDGTSFLGERQCLVWP